MENDIKQRIISDYKYLEKLGYQVLGVFLQGSQNYGADFEGSDIDTKAIVIPKFEEFYLGNAPTSRTVILPTSEHIDVKDIRLMFDCYKKQNINFVETLFTEYRVLNEDYEKIFRPMFEHAEEIARYDQKAFYGCMYGMTKRHKTLYERGYKECPKSLYHVLRLSEFLSRYIDGESYADCLKTKQPERLRNAKRGVFSVEEADAMFSESIEYTDLITMEVLKSDSNAVNTNVDKILDGVLKDVFEFSVKKEFGY